jgi:DNA-binding transcriptional ArsR family regulator
MHATNLRVAAPRRVTRNEPWSTNHANRRAILGLLRERPLAVGEIASNFRTSRPAVSKHLRLLKSAGLIVVHERGTANICRLNARPLRAVDDWLRDYESYWKETLRGLKKYLEEDR